MVSCFISRLVILIFGTLYPAYASYKAVRTKNVKEYVKWMMYWIVFALFTCAETFTDLFLSFWFPFYYEIKIITVIYLLSPATKGSSILYRKFVHPVLTKREQEIDEYIAKAKEQGYHTMLNLGSKGVTYATSLIMQTAIKGGGGLVNQLRKSYSLGDLNEEQHLRRQKRESEDDVDSQYGEDPRIPRRVPMRSPRHTISGTNQPGLYFSEVDAYQPIGPDDEPYYSEELSSGYSSGDPLFSSKVHPRDHLVRTASVGGSSRVRTRAAARTGLPKRSSLSEVGPTWSAMEAHESQIEPERYFNFPLTHSASFPFPFGPFGNFARPEFQHMFGNLTQQQMFTFINHSPAFFDEGMKNETENPTVVISEIKNDNPSTETVEVADDDKKEGSGGKSEEKSDGKKQEVDDSKEKEIVQIDNKDKEVVEVDNKDKEVAKVDRSGKYKKKPAPVPPVGDVPPKDESDDEDVEFTTPNSSPLPERKKISEKDSVPESKKNTETNSGQLLEVPKTKTKNKSNKKLHLPKMAFSFWHKGNKRMSGSETSSIASSENVSAANESRSELEYFIPLKDDSEQQTKTDSK